MILIHTEWLQNSDAPRKQNESISNRFSVVSTLYSGYQSHALLNDFFTFEKLSFGGRQSNVSMTIVVFISCQFHSHVRSSFD